MKLIWETIVSSFSQVKESGSYFLFYLLALGLGLIVAWDRYGKAKSGDNWMVEEAKKKIQLWPFLFGLLSLLLIAANPLSVWVLNKVFPVQGNYDRLWFLLLVFFLIAYAVVCFASLLGEARQRNVVVVSFALLIGLAGSCYGLLSQRQSEEVYSQEEEVISVFRQLTEGEKEEQEIVLLAPERVLEYVGMYEPDIRLLYGKDLYMANLDMGILDTYPPEFLGIYEVIQNPKGNLMLLSQMAVLYGCRVIILEDFGNEPKSFGSFALYGRTGNYLIYCDQ